MFWDRCQHAGLHLSHIAESGEAWKASPPPSAPSPSSPQPLPGLLDWIDVDCRARGEDHAAFLQRLCDQAEVLIAELSGIMAFPDPRSMLAAILLDEFATARGLTLAEAATLLPDPSAETLLVIDQLLARTGQRPSLAPAPAVRAATGSGSAPEVVRASAHRRRFPQRHKNK